MEKNRGNDLLINLLQYRYPRVIDSDTLPTLREWLGTEGAHREALIRKFEVDDGQSIQDLKQYIVEHSSSFPMLIGDSWLVEKKTKLTLHLVRDYIIFLLTNNNLTIPCKLFSFRPENT